MPSHAVLVVVKANVPVGHLVQTEFVVPAHPELRYSPGSQGVQVVQMEFTSPEQPPDLNSPFGHCSQTPQVASVANLSNEEHPLSRYLSAEHSLHGEHMKSALGTTLLPVSKAHPPSVCILLLGPRGA